MQKKAHTKYPSEGYSLRSPEVSDGNSVYKLIKECPPLDLNSLYCYILLCAHFHATSVVAVSGDKTLGYISAYLHPERTNTLFIWQVAVHSDARKIGLASKMIYNILKRQQCREVEFIETTVSPSNSASAALFRGIAKMLKTECIETEYFQKELFSGESHEPEFLFRIGSFKNE